MITFFNREEVFISNDLNARANARDILRDAGIDCICKTVRNNNSAAVRGRMGGVGENSCYKIFTYKKRRKAAKDIISYKYNEIFIK